MGMDCGCSVSISFCFLLYSLFFLFFSFLLGVEHSNVRQGLDSETLERNGATGLSYLKWGKMDWVVGS